MPVEQPLVEPFHRPDEVDPLGDRPLVRTDEVHFRVVPAVPPAASMKSCRSAAAERPRDAWKTT
jgi:hypothetical protein